MHVLKDIQFSSNVSVEGACVSDTRASESGVQQTGKIPEMATGQGITARYVLSYKMSLL